MANWCKIMDKLLENNHINISIEKRLFLSFIENEGDQIDKNIIIEELKKNGILNDDPRIKNFISKLNMVKTSFIIYEEFQYCLDNSHKFYEPLYLFEQLDQQFYLLPFHQLFLSTL